ncbi:MAG: hypothetical protein H6Q00_1326 [Holophagaceae bacterium]|nr:hypothetical protein [Holophagaceae bacterium]
MLRTLVFALILASGITATAGDPLFINMTTDEAHRASMAISFGKNQMDRGHGLTVFLNDRGVVLASKLRAEQYSGQQKVLLEIVSRGGAVLVCPMCMKQYGVLAVDLLPGLKLSNPDLTGAALFAKDGRTLSW